MASEVRVGRAGLLIAALVLAGLAFVGGLLSARHLGNNDHSAGAAASAEPSLQWLVAEPQPLRQSVILPARLEPGVVVSVIAPFSGRLLRRSFEFGQWVEAGAPLFELDSAELELQLREARAAAIRARQQVAELVAWERGPEARRAARQFAQAREQLELHRRREAETRRLLERGIVAQQEHEGMQLQLSQQTAAVAAAGLDLEAVLERGSDENLQLARLELMNAEARLERLEEQRGSALVQAPVGGIVLLPTGGEVGRTAPLDVGTPLEEGRVLLRLGGLEELQARATVDEIDVGRVAPGQTVELTGEGLGRRVLHGVVTTVSAAAAPLSGSRTPAGFEVVAQLEAPGDAELTFLRLGMTAILSILIYENPAALLVPPTALELSAEGPLLRVIPTTGALAQSRQAVIGATVPAGIEIIEGLAEGEFFAIP